MRSAFQQSLNLSGYIACWFFPFRRAVHLLSGNMCCSCNVRKNLVFRKCNCAMQLAVPGPATTAGCMF